MKKWGKLSFCLCCRAVCNTKNSSNHFLPPLISRLRKFQGKLENDITECLGHLKNDAKNLDNETPQEKNF